MPFRLYLHGSLKKSPRLRFAPGRVTPPTRSPPRKRFLGRHLPILPWMFLAIGCRVFLGVASWVFGFHQAVRPFVLDKPAEDRVPDFPQGLASPPWLVQSNPPAALQPGRRPSRAAPFSLWSCPGPWAWVASSTPAFALPTRTRREPVGQERMRWFFCFWQRQVEGVAAPMRLCREFVGPLAKTLGERNCKHVANASIMAWSRVKAG